MKNIMKKSFTSADEVVKPGQKMTAEFISVGSSKLQRNTAEPGWMWSKHMKSFDKTESCQRDHLLYVISGKVAARMSDGSEMEFGPGEIGEIPPGHDGWTVGTEPVVWLEIPH